MASTADASWAVNTFSVKVIEEFRANRGIVASLPRRTPLFQLTTASPGFAELRGWVSRLFPIIELTPQDRSRQGANAGASSAARTVRARRAIMVTGSDFNARIIREFRANKGKIGGEFEGGNFLILHTVGRRTGQKRLTPMAYIPYGDRLLVVAAGPGEQGTPRDPDWYRNLMAHPETTIEIGSDTRRVTAAMVDPDEQEAAWASVIAAIPLFSAYRTNPDRDVPLVALTTTGGHRRAATTGRPQAEPSGQKWPEGSAWGRWDHLASDTPDTGA